MEKNPHLNIFMDFNELNKIMSTSAILLLTKKNYSTKKS